MSASSSASEAAAIVGVPALSRVGYQEAYVEDPPEPSYRPLEIRHFDAAPKEVMGAEEWSPRLDDHLSCGYLGRPGEHEDGGLHARSDGTILIEEDIQSGPRFVAGQAGVHELPVMGAMVGGISEWQQWPERHQLAGRCYYWRSTLTRGFGQDGWEEVNHWPGGSSLGWREGFDAVGRLDAAMSSRASRYERPESIIGIKKVGYREWFNGSGRLTRPVAPAGGYRSDVQKESVFAVALLDIGDLIGCHSRWYHCPTALGRMLISIGPYAWAYRRPSAALAGSCGAVARWRIARARASCISVDSCDSKEPSAYGPAS